MSDPKRFTRTELDQRIHSAWAEFETCLGGLSEKQMTDLRDDQGWNVIDHITHLAAWEESVALLAQGQPRHQTLGVEASRFNAGSIDETNEIIRERWSEKSNAEALKKFRGVHAALMAWLATLSDEDVNQPVSGFFQAASPGDSRRVAEIILGNTSDHYLEHMDWIKTLAKSTN